MGCLAVYGRLGRAALLIIAGRTSEFGSSVMSHSLLESRECDSPCRVLRGAPIASDEPVTAQLAGYRPRWSPVGMLARARCGHVAPSSSRCAGCVWSFLELRSSIPVGTAHGHDLLPTYSFLAATRDEAQKATYLPRKEGLTRGLGLVGASGPAHIDT